MKTNKPGLNYNFEISSTALDGPGGGFMRPNYTISKINTGWVAACRVGDIKRVFFCDDYLNLLETLVILGYTLSNKDRLIYFGY